MKITIEYIPAPNRIIGGCDNDSGNKAKVSVDIIELSLGNLKTASRLMDKLCELTELVKELDA